MSQIERSDVPDYAAFSSAIPHTFTCNSRRNFYSRGREPTNLLVLLFQGRSQATLDD